MLRTGRVEDAKKNAEKLAEVIKNSGAKKILVTCAGCLKTLRLDFPKLGIELPEILHVTELLQEIIEENTLEMMPLEKGVRVTYHDPCHLSRTAGVYESPREVLKAIPGVDLVEMETTRETAMCCGAGGGLRSYDAELSKKMAADRVKSALDIDAEIIATACPFCENNLIAGAALIDSSIRIVDVVDLLAERLK
jgi:heterodisulfide reductase subunit D